jgi:hypothetical protein
MNYSIVYDRAKQETILREQYSDEEGEELRVRRLELELNAQILGEDVEVVVLQAASEDALMKTHARYFKSEAEKLTFANAANEFRTRR